MPQECTLEQRYFWAAEAACRASFQRQEEVDKNQASMDESMALRKKEASHPTYL